MPTRIAHLSDLHYGGAFDIALWQSVQRAVATFNPHLLIVSGDMVDDPREDHLWAAKQELDRLAASLKAGLYVVAGNHDLFFSGLDITGGRSGWFDHIFNRKADAPPPTAGFTRLEGGRWQTLKDRARVFLGRGAHAVRPPAPLPPSPRGAAAPMLREPEQTRVLLALIDSNAANEPVRLATGSVSTDDLVSLDAELQRVGIAPHLARIAVIHHHLLPIAYTAGGIIGAEPFMVLHNAGDVLGLLARHQFDLVLHGHKHRAQFARIDLSPDSAEGYPIAVAAAGSAALRTPNNPLGNSFNLITIQDNGRIDVESLHYGAATAPNRNGRKGEAVKKYTETIESTKRRAFIRSCQRYPILCSRRVLQFEISELGDLVVHHRTVGLRVLRGYSEYRKRPHIVRIPPYGRLAFDLQLDAASLREGYTIEPVAADASDGRRIVVLRENLAGGDREASYAVSHACANCMTMTRWEAEERSRADSAHPRRLRRFRCC
jgi:predicted phosphodiesterase